MAVSQSTHAPPPQQDPKDERIRQLERFALAASEKIYTMACHLSRLAERKGVRR